jgi:hypothetical protein
MKKSDVEIVARGVSPVLREFRERVDKLEARLAAVEQRPAAVAYRGIWEPGQTYHRGDFVTRAGSVWHCELDSSRGIIPGTSTAWKLACKKGSDGRDAKEAGS